MISELPWNQIEPSLDGAIQGRFVNENSRWQFYWAKTIENPWMLAMEHSVARIENLPEYQGLAVENRSVVSDKSVLLLKLEYENLQDVFYVFCLDLIKIVNSETLEEVAVAKLLSEIRRWHRLLNSNSSALSFEGEQGIVAELHVFGEIMARTSPVFALEAWVGPLGAAKDFISNDSAIEVKSVGSGSEKTVHISSEFQLDFENLSSLYLDVVALSSSGPGETLQEIVDRLRSCIMQKDLQEKFNVLLSLGNVIDSAKSSSRTWTVTDEIGFEIDSAFPAISSSALPRAIHNVKYKIDLSICHQWQRESEEMYRTFSVNEHD